MMKDHEIWKFILDQTNIQEIKMPKDAEIIHAGAQNRQICLWAIVDPEAERETRVFAIYGTGHPLPPVPGAYVGTMQIEPFVWHVFEKFKKDHEHDAVGMPFEVQ